MQWSNSLLEQLSVFMVTVTSGLASMASAVSSSLGVSSMGPPLWGALEGFIYVVGIYASPLASTGTFLVVTLVYYLLAPSWARRIAWQGAYQSGESGLVGLVCLAASVVLMLVFILAIVTWPLLLVLLLVTAWWFLVAACTLPLVVVGWVVRLAGKNLPYSRLGLLGCNLLSIVGLGLLALVPKLGGFLLTVAFIITLGAVVLGSRSLTRPGV